MSMSVYVIGREVATLEAQGDLKSLMTYQEGVAGGRFRLPAMHVRRQPYIWDDVLHPSSR